MTFDPAKPFRTRDGREVINFSRPSITGYFSGWVNFYGQQCWLPDGSVICQNRALDLVNIAADHQAGDGEDDAGFTVLVRQIQDAVTSAREAELDSFADDLESIANEIEGKPFARRATHASPDSGLPRPGDEQRPEPVAPDQHEGANARGSAPEWRVGSHYGIHVYAGETPVATFMRAEDAAAAVAAVNGASAPEAASKTPAPEPEWRVSDEVVDHKCRNIKAVGQAGYELTTIEMAWLDLRDAHALLRTRPLQTSAAIVAVERYREENQDWAFRRAADEILTILRSLPPSDVRAKTIEECARIVEEYGNTNAIADRIRALASRTEGGR